MEMPNPNQTKRKAGDEEFRRLLENGQLVSEPDLAEELHVKSSTIRLWCRYLSIKPPYQIGNDYYTLDQADSIRKVGRSKRDELRRRFDEGKSRDLYEDRPHLSKEANPIFLCIVSFIAGLWMVVESAGTSSLSFFGGLAFISVSIVCFLAWWKMERLDMNVRQEKIVDILVIIFWILVFTFVIIGGARDMGIF